MADNDVLLQIRGDVSDIKAKLAEFRGAMDKARQEAKRLGEESKTSWQMMTAGWASLVYLAGQLREKLGAVIAVVRDLGNAAADAETVDLKLIATMKEHNIAGQGMVTAYMNMASAIQEKTGVDDEQIKTAMRMLTIMGVGPGLMRQSVEATIALVKAGRDMETATRMVGMAMNGEYQQLGRMIPAFRNLERKGLDAQAALKLLAGATGDVEAALGSSYNQKVERLTAAWGDFKELLGNYLLPYLKEVVDRATKAVHVLAGLMGNKDSLEWKKKEIGYLQAKLNELETTRPKSIRRPGAAAYEARFGSEESLEKAVLRSGHIAALQQAIAKLKQEVAEQEKRDKAALAAGNKDWKPPKAPDQRTAADRLAQEESALKSVIQGYRSQAEVAAETNRRILSDRELSLRQGAIGEQQFAAEKRGLDAENARTAIESLQKQEAATIASFRRRKDLALSGQELAKVEQAEAGELARIRGELAKAHQQQLIQDNQGQMQSITLSERYAAALRDGEYAIVSELARQEKELLRLRVARGDLTQSDAVRRELEIEAQLLEKRKENLKAELKAPGKGDAERLAITLALRAVQLQIESARKGGQLLQQEADRQTALANLGKIESVKQLQVELARIRDNYDEQHQIELELITLERDRLLLQAQLTDEQKKAIRALHDAKSESAERQHLLAGIERLASARQLGAELAGMTGSYEEQHRLALELLELEAARLQLQRGLTAEERRMALALLAEKKRRAELMASGLGGQAALALKDEGRELMDLYRGVRDTIQGAFRGMTESLTDFVMTGKSGFTDLANSIIRDMIRIVIQQRITGPLALAAGGLLERIFAPSAPAGVAGGPAVAGGYAGGSFAGFHKGGMGTEPSFYRFVLNPDLLPRYHRGIGPGERPAIITDDESVLTPGQMKRFYELASATGQRGGPQSLKIEVVTSGDNPQRVTDTRVDFRAQEMVVTLFLDALDRNAYGLRHRLGG